MDTTGTALLASWNRQTRILGNLADLVDESSRHAKPSPEGWTVDNHLCHIHETRYTWLSKVSPDLAKPLGDVFIQHGEEWTPIESLDEIRRQLVLSGQAVRAAVKFGLEHGVTRVGPYANPVHFLEHMIWHEGYHFGLLVLALRNVGKEPDDAWMEANVWGIWRS